MPLIVSPSLVTNTPADELADRLKRPHIGWHNVLPHQLVQCPPELKDPLTWNRWRGIPNFPNLLQIDRNSVAANGAINYIGIASHNLGTIGREVQIRHFSDNTLGPEMAQSTTPNFRVYRTAEENVLLQVTPANAIVAGRTYEVRVTVASNIGTADATLRIGLLIEPWEQGQITFAAGENGEWVGEVTSNVSGTMNVVGNGPGADLVVTKVSVRQTGVQGWKSLARFTPTSDDAIMVIFEDETTPAPGNFDQWQVSIAASTTPPEIGAMAMGRVLVMPHCIYGGHSPATLSRNTEIEPNVSIGGRFLGRSIIRRGYRTDYEFRHLPAQWYREHFDPFVEHALREPFFISWKPDKFPAEVLYGWTTDDIRPVNMGIRDLMSVSFGVEGWR